MSLWPSLIRCSTASRAPAVLSVITHGTFGSTMLLSTSTSGIPVDTTSLIQSSSMSQPAMISPSTGRSVANSEIMAISAS